MIKQLIDRVSYSQIDWHLNFIYFYIFITPWHFSKAQTSILSAILFIWTIFKYKKEFWTKFIKISKFLPLSLLFMFIGYKFIAIFWSEDFLVGFKHVSNYNKYYFLFVPVILVSLNYENAIKALKLLVISFGLYGVYSILIYLGILNIEGTSSFDPKGHLRYLIVSQYMVIAFFVSILISYYSKIKYEKILFALISSISLFSLFINNSRTAQLSFFIILIIIFIIYMKQKFNIKLLLGFCFIFILSLYFLFYTGKDNRFQSSYKNATTILKNNKYEGSFGLRVYFNKAGLEIFKDNFLFGTGPKDNRHLLQKIQQEDKNYTYPKIFNHFHSEHMDTLTAYGSIGYGLLVSSIIYLIYSLRNQILYYYTSLAVFLTLFFNSFANKTLSVKPLNYVYILFFILFAIIAFKSKENQKVKIENNS